ncbi:MAG: sulfite exporter TauE/SafE family protein [Betaproteobacteria bacterium]|nr:MAG: sulfite exporter TauE/SafE family protein [Betaproteobacteria bacterium]
MEAGLAAAFVIGLLGGVHCAGMCGGIVGALTVQTPRLQRAWKLHLAYSAGRITSYAAAGAIMGLIGGAGLLFNQILPVQLLLYVLANLVLISLGLYLAGIGNQLTRLEGLGAALWRRVRPYSSKVLPADTVTKAFALGTLWGWLPCGLVYSLLATALLSGSAAGGAAVMLAFGLGTLPNLLLAGMAFKRLRDVTSNRRLRLAAGVLVAGFGVVGLARAADLGEHIRQGLLCIL